MLNVENISLSQTTVASDLTASDFIWYPVIEDLLYCTKNGQRAWTIWSRALWCTMHGFMHGFVNWIITHARRLRAYNRAGDRVTLLTFKHLMPLKMTGRRPREATMNNRESWKGLLQHEHRYSTRWFQMANFCRTNHTVYFRVVHRSCVVSVDQVDTCCETKYLACVPWCLCEVRTDSGCQASYARLVPYPAS